MPPLNNTPFPSLGTNRLHLRELTFEDENGIFELRSDDSINKYINRPKAQSITEAKQFIEKIRKGIANNQSLYWVISLKEDPTLIGTICLWNFSADHCEAETGFELMTAHQGKGIMNEALKEVIRFAFEILGLDRINAYTHKENSSSIKLLEKNSFLLSETEDDHLIYVLKRNHA
jgi:ribosomal-protein-alanine N-acetyltransferase